MSWVVVVIAIALGVARTAHVRGRPMIYIPPQCFERVIAPGCN